MTDETMENVGGVENMQNEVSQGVSSAEMSQIFATMFAIKMSWS